jgi:hypothetical protein
MKMKKFNNQKRVTQPSPLQLQQILDEPNPIVRRPLAKIPTTIMTMKKLILCSQRFKNKYQPTTFIRTIYKSSTKNLFPPPSYLFFATPTLTAGSLLIISDTLNSLSSLSQLLHYKQSDLVAKAHTHTTARVIKKRTANMCLTSHGSVSKMRELPHSTLFYRKACESKNN